MKIRVPEYFKEFKCISSECEDTCCAGWEVVIDDEAYKHYKNVKGEFGERLRNEIVNDGKDNIFKLKNNNCPFLNKNKLCDIYNNIGEESLCYICKQYPRYMEEFGGLREVGISLSCPEAARIILRDSKKVEFELSENDEVITSYNDIDAQLFLELMQCRKLTISILQDRSVELNTRAAIALEFISEVQYTIDEDEIFNIKAIREKYSNKAFIKETIDNLEKYKNNGTCKYDNIYKYFSVFKELTHINNNDPLGLENVLRYFWQSSDDEEFYLNKHKEFNKYYEDKAYKFENILVYFVFRYFMKAVFDYNVSSKLKIAIVSYLMIKELSVVRYIEESEFTDKDIVDISHTYSKDIEHLEENIETLEELFKDMDIFQLDEIITTLMN